METQIRSSRWTVWIGLLIIIVALSLFMPQIIDLYTGAPPIQAPPDDNFQLPMITEPINKSTETLNSKSVSPSPVATSVSSNRSGTNCTFDKMYWIYHPDQIPVEGISFGDFSYNNLEVLSILAIGSTDLRTILVQQLITYGFNTFRGADPNAILPTVKDASDWITRNHDLEALTEADRAIGLQLADRLTNYNRGLIGPGPCPEVPDTPTPTLTATPTVTPTVSPTSTSTSTATIVPFIPQPTEKDKPKKKRTPVPPPPTDPPPPPVPTNTEPPPPTQPPPTQPPPTSVPTAPPTPTSPPG